ncbi:hypothetical protein ACFPL7_12180 [Dongia soli]|uniref:Uncharacterized protein n=1 Tax=Dongia soli TaxID=600628 RepID=A0ABU5EHT2_9PROT|nr:hypothetical protein [Dongia soli]MDY0885429.1 hypothetical protein [Dongia soli]
MSGVKRRINSTGRKRIGHDRINIRLAETAPGQPLKATAALRLDDLGFPPHAAVALEAYYRSSGMRFPCGTIGNLNVPSVLVLDEIDHDSSVLFRVKVIDRESSHGRLLGSAERVSPREAGDQEGRRGILPVIERDLGHEIWKVDFSEDGPKLMLNNRISGVSARILGNAFGQALVLPAALRIVLEQLAHESEEDDSWQAQWLDHIREKFNIPDNPADLPDEAAAEWIDEVIRGFCGGHDFIGSIKAMSEKEARDA